MDAKELMNLVDEIEVDLSELTKVRTKGAKDKTDHRKRSLKNIVSSAFGRKNAGRSGEAAVTTHMREIRQRNRK